MRVFLHRDSQHDYRSVNFAVAAEGFKVMGWEVVGYQDVATILPDLLPDDIVVDYLDECRQALQQLGIAPPSIATYPDVLHPLLGRRIWASTIDTIAARPDLWPVFVKPRDDSKKFTGVLVRGTRDLVGCGDPVHDTPVWCSEPIILRAEWRCFVRYGEIVDVRLYKGDWRLHFDPHVIEAAVTAWADKPRGCAVDFAVDAQGRTVLVEANDGIALGAYGLAPRDYARLLSARWTELVGVPDGCDF